MRWSLKLGSVAGIGIFVHWTFVLLIGWIVWMHMRAGDDAAATMEGVGFILALFGCVLLHELGHALTAKRFSVRTRDITLLPIGGVARLERIPEKPIQEFLVAIAGPAVNVVIAIVLFLILGASGAQLLPEALMQPGGHFLTKLMWVNVSLVVFNMIPAFPMDGGRVLRAALAMRLEYSQATQIAATVGQVFAIVFGLLGLFFNPFLLFIALFVFIGAQSEAHAASMKSAMAGVPVRDAMVTRFITIREDDTLDHAIDALRQGVQKDFPVLDGDEVVGLLTRDDMIRALAAAGPDQRVDACMRRDCLQVRDDEMLADVLQRMTEHQCSSLAVVNGGGLIGLLTLENVGEFMQISAARRRVSDTVRRDQS